MLSAVNSDRQSLPQLPGTLGKWPCYASHWLGTVSTDLWIVSLQGLQTTHYHGYIWFQIYVDRADIKIVFVIFAF